VNRIYFERRRLQTTGLLTGPEELQRQLERHLRVAELTAHLDGLTGGYFSETLKKNRNRWNE